MKRRSFLGFLLAAPVAAPIAVKAMAGSGQVKRTILPDGAIWYGEPPVNYAFLHDENGSIIGFSIRGDMVVDGSITAEKLSVGSLPAISAYLPSVTPWS